MIRYSRITLMVGLLLSLSGLAAYYLLSEDYYPQFVSLGGITPLSALALSLYVCCGIKFAADKFKDM